jgi:hypothetical protein
MGRRRGGEKVGCVVRPDEAAVHSRRLAAVDLEIEDRAPLLVGLGVERDHGCSALTRLSPRRRV